MRFKDTERGKAWNAAYNRKWRLAHPDYWRRRAWNKMGLDPEATQRVYDSTDNCAICSRSITGYKKHVDHGHHTSIPRGVLCNECNLAIGLLHEDTETMKSAIRYLIAYNRNNGRQES